MTRSEVNVVELRYLKYFATLAETLNFTQAAESLFISQSTLSKQIADMERELHCSLFERTRHSVTLTDAGRALLPEARQIIQQVGDLGPLVHGASPSGTDRRQIRVGLDKRMLYNTRVTDAACGRIFQLRASMPLLHSGFSVREFDDLVASLEAGSTDVGFFLHQTEAVNSGSSNSDLKTIPLFEDELVVAVRSKVPIADTTESLRDATKRHGVTLLQWERRGMAQALQSFQDLGIDPPIHFAEDRETLSLVIASGESAVVLPKTGVHFLCPPDVQILHLNTPTAALHGIAVRHRGPVDSILDGVIDAVRESIDTSSR